jgi:hypothetical protein
MEMNVRAIEFFSSENMVKSASKGLRQHDGADSRDGLAGQLSRRLAMLVGLDWIEESKAG